MKHSSLAQSPVLSDHNKLAVNLPAKYIAAFRKVEQRRKQEQFAAAQQEQRATEVAAELAEIERKRMEAEELAAAL